MAAVMNSPGAAPKSFVAMVVEDDADARRAIAEYLHHRGVLVVEAGNAEEAKELMKFVRPNLAIVDVMMQGRPEGYDVCRAPRDSS